MTQSKEERLLQSIGTLLNLFTVNEDRFPSAEGQMRYNPIDFQTLRHIKAKPGCSGAEIARALGVAPTTQQSALDRLIRSGLVKRKNNPDSKRSKIHELTKDGKRTTAAIHRQDLSNMKTILAALSRSEQNEVVKLLEKVVMHLEK